MLEAFERFVGSMGFQALTAGNVLMMLIAGVLIWLAIKKGFEPLLLLPIGLGALLTNIPLNGLLNEPTAEAIGGLYYYISQGIHLEIFPPLIFLGIGAMTDFGPLLANPKTFLLGAGAQFGVFSALFLAIMLGFSPREAAYTGRG